MAEIKKYLDQAGLEALVAKIKAEDGKTLDASKAYADSLGKNYDAAGSAATAEANAKAYAKEYADGLAGNYDAAGSAAAVDAKLTAEVERATAKEAELVAAIEATDAKAVKNAEDIAAINNADTGILAQAKADATSKANAVQANVDALAGKVGEVPEGSTVMDIIADIQENAYDDTEVRGLISDLDENKADKTQVATDIADAVKAEKEAREAAVYGVQSAVDTLSGTHATDKAALEASIATKADQTTVDELAEAAATKTALEEEVNRAKGEEARIEGLVTAEAERADGVEKALDERLVKVETFFETAEGETISDAMDTLVEIQKYITEDGAAADQMVKDIAANKKAIEDHVATDHDFAAADATLKSELEGKIDLKADKTTVEGIDGRLTTAEGKITTVEGKVSTLEGEMDAVEAAVATKAEAQALTDAVAALEGADAGQVERIEALEAKFGDGEGNVESQIEAAKQAAIDAAAADATTKANSAEANAKTHADGLNTAMDERVDALEADAHTHSNKALLDTYTQTEADLADAVAKKHEHSNLAVLESITGALVNSWSNAEKNAKDYADGLNTAMTTKVDGIDTRVGTLETTIVDKAEQDDLDAAVERIAAVEAKAAANETAINSFVAIGVDEINALFA